MAEKIPVEDQALIEWTDLNYFIPGKPASNAKTGSNMIDA